MYKYANKLFILWVYINFYAFNSGNRNRWFDMVLMNISDPQTVKAMLNGKTDYVEAKQRKRPLKRGDILHFYYQLQPGKCCENCIVPFLDISYNDVPVNCPHAGICKHFTSFIGSVKITGVLPAKDDLYRFRFNKIIQQIDVRGSEQHG